MVTQTRDWWQGWGVPLLVAAAIGYCVYPPATTLLLVAEGLGVEFGKSFSGIILVVQALVFVIAFVWLFRANGARRHAGKGLVWAGGLMLLTLPMLVLNIVIAPPSEMAASFFMLLIFGLFYGIIGAVILGFGIYLLRRTP